MYPIGPITQKILTIANGASVSDALPCGNARAIAVVLPNPWTAADVGVEVSTDGGATWAPMFDNAGNEYAIKAAAAAARFVVLSLQDWLGVTYFRLASGPSTARVNQGAQRQIVVVLAP
jgi:hypothetical protein